MVNQINAIKGEGWNKLEKYLNSSGVFITNDGELKIK